MVWNEEQCTLFTNKLGREIAKEEMKGIVETLMEKGFFDKETYKEHGILTSVEIQRVWLEATKRRKRDLESLPYMLVKTEESDKGGKDGKVDKETDGMQNPQNCMQDADNFTENADNSEQNKTEQNKAFQDFLFPSSFHSIAVFVPAFHWCIECSLVSRSLLCALDSRHLPALA